MVHTWLCVTFYNSALQTSDESYLSPFLPVWKKPPGEQCEYRSFLSCSHRLKLQHFVVFKSCCAGVNTRHGWSNTEQVQAGSASDLLPYWLRRVFKARTGSDTGEVKSFFRIRNPPNSMGSKVHLALEDFGFFFHVARTVGREKAQMHTERRWEKSKIVICDEGYCMPSVF